MTFCVFNGHERNKLFWASLFSLLDYWSQSIKFCCCDFLANVLMKRLFLTSTTQTLPICNGENCSVDGF